MTLPVVGCNPRLFQVNFNTCKPNPDFERLLKETCLEILGCAETDSDPSHFNWVVGVVMHAIDTATVGENKITISSLFSEDIVEGKRLTVFTRVPSCASWLVRFEISSQLTLAAS